MTTTQTAAAIGAPSQNGWADWAGMIASVGCAIHCAAMPLVLAYLPTFGLGWLASEGFHKWMAVICFGLAALAFVPGWRKHRSFLPAMWGGLGLLLLTTAAFALEDSCCPSCAGGDQQVAAASASATVEDSCAECESCQLAEQQQVQPAATFSLASITPFVTPLGGIFLVVGHIVNHRQTCRCRGDNCCLDEKLLSLEI